MFGLVVLAAVLIDLVVLAAAANFSVVMDLSGLWYLLPAMVFAALIVRPAWGAAVAGVGAGGLIGVAIETKAILTGGVPWTPAVIFAAVGLILTGGVPWTPAVIFAAVGLIGTAVLLTARLFRIFPDALQEVHDKPDDHSETVRS
jgi:hypothetical protein